MEMLSVSFFMTIFAVYFLALVLPSINAQAPAPAPAPANDGAAIDRGIACALMLLALAVTYIIH